MPKTPIFHKKAAKFIKKIRKKDLKTKLKFEINHVIKNPQDAKDLEHPFRKYKIKCHRFNYEGQTFRIAYTVSKSEIVFLVIDSRENFYEKLKQIL